MNEAIRTEGLTKDYGAGRGLFDLELGATAQALKGSLFHVVSPFLVL